MPEFVVCYREILALSPFLSSPGLAGGLSGIRLARLRRRVQHSPYNLVSTAGRLFLPTQKAERQKQNWPMMPFAGSGRRRMLE
jgi:hypothetical protein